MTRPDTLLTLASLPAIVLVSSCKNDAQKGFDQQISAINDISEILENAAKKDVEAPLEADFKAAVNKYKAAMDLEEQASPTERARLEKDSRRIDNLNAARQRLASALSNLTAEQKEKFARLLQEIGF